MRFCLTVKTCSSCAQYLVCAVFNYIMYYYNNNTKRSIDHVFFILQPPESQLKPQLAEFRWCSLSIFLFLLCTFLWRAVWPPHWINVSAGFRNSRVEQNSVVPSAKASLNVTFKHEPSRYESLSESIRCNNMSGGSSDDWWLLCLAPDNNERNNRVRLWGLMCE